MKKTMKLTPKLELKPLRIIVIYYTSSSNLSLSYQIAWPSALMTNDLLDAYPVNLGQSKYISFLKLVYYLIFKRPVGAIFCMHSVFSNSKNITGLMTRVLKIIGNKKIYFLGNEYKLMPDKIKLIKSINPDIVFTQSYDQHIIDLYSTEVNCTVKSFTSCAIDDGQFYCNREFKDRAIDIGYRSYKSPIYLGHNERHQIAEFFTNYCKQNDLIADISLEPDKRLNVEEYSHYLNSCKFQIGTEAGGDYF